MLFCGLLIQMVIKQSDSIACLPAWAEDGQEIPKNIYLLSFDSLLMLGEATEWLFLSGFGLALLVYLRGRRMVKRYPRTSIFRALILQ